MSTPIRDMRREYGRGALREADVDADPMVQFRRWFDEAAAASADESFEPNAMTLATCSRSGVPSARIVLLKQVDERGFVFYGNYGSQKGREMAENPVACLLFFWPPLERQVRVNGMVEKVGRAEAEAYFRSRPRGSQIGAVASHQSRPVADRADLEQRFAELQKQYGGQDHIPMPDEWGGWLLRPERMEFWQGQASRLHDRLVYERNGDQWTITRLSP